MYPIESINKIFCAVLLSLLSLSTSAQTRADFSADTTAGCSPLVVHFRDLSAGNPTQWIWNLGNGTISQLQHPTGTYFQPGTYNIKLVVKNAAGSDSVIKNQFIVVYPNPAVAFSLSDSVGCFPKDIRFTDRTSPGAGSITQWSWDFGDGTISNIQHPAHTYAQPGAYSVTLKAVNSFGCQSTLTRGNVITLGNSVADFDITNNSGCQLPASVIFTNRSSNATAYSWDFGDGSFSTAINPVHNYTTPGNYTVRLRATSGAGCADTVVKQLVIGKAVADFVVPATACVGAPLEFRNTSSATPASAVWTFSDGTVISQVNATKTFATAGTYQVKLVSNFGNCSDSITKTIIVRPKPVAAFTASGDLVKCGPTAVVRFANSSTGATGYTWSFGDGSTATLANPVHNYTAAGIFNVSLIAVNTFGCIDSVRKESFVKIRPPKITGISGLPYAGCAPHSVNLSAVVDSQDPVTAWSWDFGDGTTSTAATPSHLYATPGTYTIKLVITTAGGCTDTYVYPSAVRVSNKPVANFSAAPLVVCAAAPVQFTNQSTGADEWFWIFGDGGFSNDRDPSHQFGDTGVFTIKLVASRMGCADTFIIKDYVRNEPPIGRYNIVRDCSKPFEIQFRDSSIGGQTYKWIFGDGDSSTLQHPVHTYRSPGIYNFEFIVYHGGCSYKSTGTVNIVDEHPRLSVTDTILCKRTSADFVVSNVNLSNIASYNWDFGDGAGTTTTSPGITHDYTQAGTFHPRLIATDVVGCTDTLNAVVEAKIFGPTAAFINIDGTCIGRSVTFKDSSATDGVHQLVEWKWSYGDGSPAAFTPGNSAHVYPAKGVYDISLRVKDSYGCYDSVLKPAAVMITSPLAAFVSADSIRCSGNNVQFNNESEGVELSYAWRFGDGSTSATLHPQHAYRTQSVFNVGLVVTDKFGCKDSIMRPQVISDPVASFTASDSFSTCPPLLVTLANRSSGIAGFSWDFGDGGISSNNNPSHFYTAPGTYRLTLYANGYGSCRDSVSKTVVVKGPIGSFHFSPGTICTNASVGFTANTKNNTKFIWDFSDGSTSATADSGVSHIYDVPGFYQPKLILIDSAGCQVPVTTKDTLRVMGVQARIGVAQGLFCDSVDLRLKDSSVIFNDLPSAYSWNFGDGTVSGASNPVHRYNKPGKYDVSLAITTRAGCTDSVRMPSFITIVKSPQIGISNRPSVCLADTVRLQGRLLVPDSSTVAWNWNLGNGSFSSAQNPSASYSSAGNAQVELVAVNSSGCSDTALSMILVHPLPDVNAGTDTMICRGQTYILQPTGAASYVWQNDPALSCLDCPNPVVNSVSNKTYYVKGISQYGCESNDSVHISVMQPFTVKVSSNDTLCAGDKVQLVANGAAKYTWYPSAGLNNATIANPVASPGATTEYMVVGSDVLNCFRDTGRVKLSVFPVPQFNITDPVLSMTAGSSATITTTSSPDVTHWKWYPSRDLSCDDCPQPVLTAKDNVTYRAEAWNDGGCASADKINISVICNGGNVFIPNTFTPNNDGMNDVFYVRGKGINSVKSVKIFNRWGQLVFERNDANPNDINAGWNGTYQDLKLTPDVYVYIVDVVCSNNTVFTLKGNVTLIR